MQDHRGKDFNLMGRTVLIAASAAPELINKLERYGARVIAWPEVEIAEAEDFTALDEAIENLFGYDWLLFQNGNAVVFFLRRLLKLGHDVSELDNQRVCAIGDATATKLEDAHVHVDVIPRPAISNIVFESIENYVGGHAALGRLNFLMPRASTAHDGLRDLLAAAEARVDVVVAYRTIANKGALAQLSALLTGGGIDCVVFDKPPAVRSLAELLDTPELAAVFAGVPVFCLNESTTSAACDYGLRPEPIPEPTMAATATAIADYFNAAR